MTFRAAPAAVRAALVLLPPINDAAVSKCWVDRERVQERPSGSIPAGRGARIASKSGAFERLHRRPDIRPNFAGRILDDDYRAIVNPSIANIHNLATQRVDDETAGGSRGSKRASRRPALTVQQTLREMRRDGATRA